MASKKKKTQPSAPAAPPSRLALKLSWAGFVAILLAGICIVVTHAYMVDAVTVRLTSTMDPPGLKPSEKLPVFLAPMAFDGYVWNRHAEYLGRDGELRLRKTNFDNAPSGREVHWNSLFAWYLRGLGEIRRAFTDDGLRNSIFRMSIWANPILLVVAMGLFATMSARRFGPLCGVVMVVGMITTPSFYEGFLPAYPDHHGIIAFALLGLAFGMAWAGGGWVQPADGTAFASPRSLETARHGMIFSAVCGAACFWISALSTAIVLGCVGLGALAAAFIVPVRGKLDKGATFHPELWKLWALVGAGATMVFYLAEYFPFHLGMRLEVNHPLYALAWVGGGWILAITTGWLASPDRSKTPFPWKSLGLPLLACAVLPAAILSGGEAVYIPADPFMARLWKNIAELLPLILRFKLGTLTWQTAFGLYPLLALAAVWFLMVQRVDRPTKAVLALLVVPIFAITGLQFYQTRWGMLAGPLYLALAGIVVPVAWRLGRATKGGRIATSAAFVALAIGFGYPTVHGWFTPVVRQFFSAGTQGMDPAQALHLLHRDMARVILNNANGKPVVLLSSPNSSCILSAFGDFRTVGTLYWENVEGLKSAAKALNAQSDDEALALLQKHGVTHVSLMTWENFITPYFHILYPQPVPGKAAENAFGHKALFLRNLPIWARPIIYPPNAFSKGLEQRILMLEIVPGQTRQEAMYHAARFLRISEGDPLAAEPFLKEILDLVPDDLPARMELALTYAGQGRNTEAAKLGEMILKDLPPQTAQAFALDLFRVLTQKNAHEPALAIARAVADRPDATAPALLDAAWALSTCPEPALRDPDLAGGYADRAGKIQHDALGLLIVRAAIEAARGNYPVAVQLASEAAATADREGNARVAERARQMVSAYEAGKILVNAP